MTWRKTWFSYLLWGLSSILICIAFGFLMFDFVKVYHLSTLFVALPIAIVLLCYFVAKKCKKSIVPLQISNNYWITMEGLVFVLLFAGGFLARLYTVTDISETEMFQMCSISFQTTEIQSFSHAFLELFVSFYKNVFYYVGNSWIVAVAVQMNLQLFSFVILYFVVRKLIGTVAALVSFAFILFSPMLITASVTLEPSVLFFMFCVLAIYFISEGVCRIIKNQKIRWYQFISVLLIGLFTGFVIYLDIVGVFVVAFAITLFFVKKYKGETNLVKHKAIYFVLYVVGILLGVTSMLFVACKFQFAELKDMFLQWETMFLPVLGQPLYTSFGITFGVKEWTYAGLMFFTLLLGILSFWESKKFDPQFAATICVLLLLALRYNSPSAQIVDRRIFIVLMLAVLAGSSLQALLIKDAQTLDEIDEEFEVYEEVKEVKVVEEVEEIKEVEVVEEVEIEPQEDACKVEIQYIPNPLPLPKKHVKKTMNYGIEVDEEKMEFDIEVSDEDDFDI